MSKSKWNSYRPTDGDIESTTRCYILWQHFMESYIKSYFNTIQYCKHNNNSNYQYPPRFFARIIRLLLGFLPHCWSTILPCPNNRNDAYDSYCKMLLAAAKNNIPRGVRKAYVPCWDDECEHLLRAHSEAQTSEDRDKAADDLFCRFKRET